MSVDDPQIPRPQGAVDVSTWRDLDHPGDSYRTFFGPRHGFGPHYVQSGGVQESTGELVEVCIRAEIDLWGLNQYQSADDTLSPADARAKARELHEIGAQISLLGNGFEVAANEADRWANSRD